MTPELKITLTKDGLIKYETIGFAGADCKEATSTLDKAMSKLGSDTNKPEIFESSDNTLYNTVTT